MPGDFVCGTCSEVYMDRPRRFWQYVYERMIGKVGRAIYPKPEPQKLPTPTPTPKIERVLLTPRDPKPEAPEERFEYLVTVGRVGRVIVATNAASAIRIAHVVNGDDEKASHAVLCLGGTTQPETEPDVEKIEKKKTVKLVEHIYRIEGPGYERELKLATFAGSDRV